MDFDGKKSFNGLMNTVSIGGAGGVIAKTALAGLQGVASTVATSTINSITYSDRDGFGFDNKGFSASMQGGMKGVLGTMANSFVNNGLGAWNSEGGMLGGFSNLNQTNVGKFNSFMGGLVGEGVNYLTTGTATFNLANLSMLGIGSGANTASMGLLELRLGRNGAGMAFGTGGTDISLGNIASVIQGIGVLGTNARINSYVKSEGLDIAAALRSQYGFGDKAQKMQLKDILKGRTQVVAGSGSGEAETVSSGSQRTVYLNGYREGMSLAEQMALGVVLGHEAYRDGKNNGTVGQKLETDRAVQGHINMAERIMQTYGADILGEGYAMEVAILKYAKESGDWGAFEKYSSSAYNSSADFWRLTNDGKLLFDGKATVTDYETGKEILSLGDLGMSDDNDYTTSLARMLGLSNTEASKIVQSMFDSKSALKQNNIGIQIQAGKGGTSGKYEQEYKNALINTVKSRTSGGVGLEQTFVTYNGQDVNLFKNHQIIFGNGFETDVYALSKIGQHYTDNEWFNILSDPALNPRQQAMYAGAYNHGTQAEYMQFLEMMQGTGRRGDPQYTAHTFDEFFAGSMKASGMIAGLMMLQSMENVGIMASGTGINRRIQSEIDAANGRMQSSQYVYDARVGQYRDTTTGRFVSPKNLPWPKYPGFAGEPTSTTLNPGKTIDRFGSLYGEFAGEPGTSPSLRGLPPGSQYRLPYTQLEVLKPFKIPTGPTMGVPAFGATGGGTQYYFQGGIYKWIQDGYLGVLK